MRSLSLALGVTEKGLHSIARRAPSLYRGPIPKIKKNGKVRYVYDTNPPLKDLLKRVNLKLLTQVQFPSYLTGSLSGNDYVSNASIHLGAQEIISEDIQSFFDSISAVEVFNIWKNFFGFSIEVSELLTTLTTKDGKLYQGVPTSSYIANLVFWWKEKFLVEKLNKKNIRYSRYVDDITLSSPTRLSDENRTWAIAQVYAMIGSSELKVNRKKQKILRAGKPMLIMGLHVNSKKNPTLPKQTRSAMRARVF